MLFTRALTLLVCLWTGAVLAIALIAAPSAFAALPSKELAGQVAARMFSIEAYGSVVLAAAAWFTMKGESLKSSWPLAMALLLVMIGTIAGYFGLQPELQQVKTTLGSTSERYGVLHGLSMGLYTLKALAWIAASMLLLWRLPAGAQQH
jgi:hypothetical protein